MDPELGGFPAGKGGKDKSLEGAAPPGEGKALDPVPGNPGMDVSAPEPTGKALLFGAPLPGIEGNELSAGKPGADIGPTGGNPPELELSAGRPGRLELGELVGGKAGKPELSEDAPGAGGMLLVAELSAGRAGNPGFGLPGAPVIGGAAFSVVKGGKAEDPAAGIPELSAPNCEGTELLSCPLGKGGNAPVEGSEFPIGKAFELELSMGKGGSPPVEPVSLVPDPDEMFELVEAIPLSGKGGRLEPLETVVSSLGSGGKGVCPEASALPLVGFCISFFFETK